MKKQVSDYCTAIGSNPLLVQGAGGNVSWKDADTLWIKASGFWLAEASEKDIFVPVELQDLKSAVSANNWTVTPKVIGASPLRPSIETLLHALMPQKIVVHLHPVDILCHLIEQGAKDKCLNLAKVLNPAWVTYQKPGAALAKAVATALINNPTTAVVLMENHGVVVGGETILEVRNTWANLLACFSSQKINYKNEIAKTNSVSTKTTTYKPICDERLNALVHDVRLFESLQSKWAICPDHVVFLGPKAICFTTPTETQNSSTSADVLFIKEHGVYVSDRFTKTQLIQLQCYFDTIIRSSPSAPLRTLTDSEMQELLNWDAEKYRQSLSQ